MVRARRGKVSPVTVTRRSVLEWLGGAAVLSLGSPLISACGEQRLSASDARLGPDGDAWAESDAGFSFQPGPEDHAVYGQWRERTVDMQQLSDVLSGWTLTVDGLVDTPLTLQFSDLVDLPRQSQTTDLHCVEGWSVLDIPWAGLHMSELFDRAQVKAAATYVTFHTIGGAYNESLPLDIALEARSMLGYGVAGSTLPLQHGFPLRVVVPRLLGYKNAKYVERIELTDEPLDGYWVERGYSYDGPVPEARLRSGKF